MSSLNFAFCRLKAKMVRIPVMCSDKAVFDADKIDSQHFGDQMDSVTDAHLENVEIAIAEKMIEKGLFFAKLPAFRKLKTI